MATKKKAEKKPVKEAPPATAQAWESGKSVKCAKDESK